MKSLKNHLFFYSAVALASLFVLMGVVNAADKKPDLVITKTIDGQKSETVDSTKIVTVNLLVENQGTATAENIKITDYYNGTKTSGLTDYPSYCSDMGNYISCSVSELAAGAELSISYSIRVYTTADGGSKTFANVSSTTSESDNSNNSDFATLTVLSSYTATTTNRITDNIQLAVAKSVKNSSGQWVPADSSDAAAVLAGTDKQEADFKIAVSNDGSKAAYNVEISDVFRSANYTASAYKNVIGAEWDSSNKVFTIASVQAKQTVVISYTAVLERKSGSATLTGVNTATLESADKANNLLFQSDRAILEGLGDSDFAYVTGGKTTSTGTTITKPTTNTTTTAKDLTFKVYSSGSTVKAGDMVYLTAMVMNPTEDTYNNLGLEIKVPTGFIFAEADQNYSSRSGSTIDWQKATLKAGDTWSLRIGLKANSNVSAGTARASVALTGTGVDSATNYISLNVAANTTANNAQVVTTSTASRLASTGSNIYLLLVLISLAGAGVYRYALKRA